jgi:hypothetical protein
MLLVTATATAKLPTMAMIRRVGKIFIGDINCQNLFVENKEILCKLYAVTGTVMINTLSLLEQRDLCKNRERRAATMMNDNT